MPALCPPRRTSPISSGSAGWWPACRSESSWLRVLSCQEIVREVEQNLDFLATSLRNVPERHRSMRAVFEHSWNLLSEQEQHVLGRLAIFREGFRREAAEQVAGARLPLLLG